MGGKRRGKKRPKYQASVQEYLHSEDFTPETNAEVAKLFNKKFTFQCPTAESWNLPSTDRIFTGESTTPWTDTKLHELKVNLNDVKSRLSDKDIGSWHEHTQNMNPSGDVINQMKRLMRVELCTQAWCKFFEIVNSFPLVPFDSAEFSSLHLCEAPGAFITSMNHYLVSNDYTGIWQWLGNTLNPYHEANSLTDTVTDDRFIYHTLPDWYFGRDNTGDIMDLGNLEHLCEKVKERGKFGLVTADGSIDCANVPGEQEAVTSCLHYCEVVTALHVLTQGGTLVLKMFTMLEQRSLDLMYLLCAAFREVNVFKPASSKSGNSEVYVVALDFQGVTDDILHKLREGFGASRPDSPLFQQPDLPPSFVSLHHQCCQLFHDYQTQTILTNLASYGSRDEALQAHLEALRRCCSREYVHRYGARPIANERRIVPQKQTYHKPSSANFTTSKPELHGGRRHKGSYTQRKEQLNLPWAQRVEQYEPFVSDDITKDGIALQGPFTLNCLELFRWSPTLGKLPQVLHNSKFCEASVLQLYMQVLSESQVSPTPDPDHNFPSLLLSHVNQLAEEGTSRIHWNTEENQPIPACLPDSASSSAEHFASIKAENENSDSKAIHYVNASTADTTETQAPLCKITLKTIREKLKVLQCGDSLIVTIGCPLTRYNAGCLFLMHMLFDKLHLFSKPSSYTTYLLAECYQPEQTSLIQSWLETFDQTELDQTGDMHILEVVPIQYIYDFNFRTFLTQANDRFLKERINYRMEMEKGEAGVT